ncbi:MAG: M20/M25/M40 family metallo-hydrolase [Capsulimonadaceae bacterium]|nr:M20/M25/M40 family metallo-hydrolase [Capsulimonadaceae bacterium]
MLPDAVNQDRLVDLFLDLVRQNTPPRSERAAAELAQRCLEAIGFECEYDDAGEKVGGGNTGNLIAFKKGNLPSAPPIFFSAHLDTVEATPGIAPVIEDGIIKTDGKTILGADDKCGVAALLEALTELNESGEPHGDIQVLLSICEEIGLLGASAMDPARIKAKYGFVFDSGPPVGAFVYHAPTQDTFEVWIRGKAAHAGAAPEEGVSAIRIAANAISRMKLGRIDPDTTANVGIIHGGTAANIITPAVYLKCEARSRVPAKLEVQRTHMIEQFDQAAAELGGTCEYKIDRNYEGYEIPMDSPVLELAEKATEQAGLDYLLRVTGGGSDANVFNRHGIPTVVVGCGMQNVHTHGEFVEISDMVQAVRLALSIVRTAAEWRE